MVAAMPARVLDPRALHHAFSLAERQVEDGVTPFVILGLANADRTIRIEAFSAPGGARVGTNAVCLLASITKPIVATAVMRLVERGDLPLTGPLPGVSGADWRPFTAWHVLSHTSGLGDVDVERALIDGSDRASYLQRVAALPQESAPGERFRYASAPFDVLAEALEARLGRPFETVLRETVLGPLGMTDTTFDPRASLPSRMAPVDLGELHERRGPVGQALVEGYTGLRLAGGGLWSTAGDVLRFGRAMLRGGELDGERVISRSFLELMTREVTIDGLGAHPDPLQEDHYALGWGVPSRASPTSPGSYGHGGASGTRLWVDPSRDLVVVYLGGSWEMPVTEISRVYAAVYAALA
jgi:CubicO group peptidase (beta-lactamase class C family)